MSDEGSINKPPKFDGSDKGYYPWLTKFEAYASMKGFECAINPERRDPAMPAAQEPAPGGNGWTPVQKAALDKNKMAMYSLTLCLTSQKSLGAVYKAKQDPAFPGGLAYMVMKFLKEKYAPQDRVSRIEYKRQITAVKMSEKENPSSMFEEFHRLSNLYSDANQGAVASNEDFMAQVFIAAPAHYQSVLNSESRAKGDQLTLDDMEKVMTELYRTTYGKDSAKRNDNEAES
jgi:hypothetical protein